MRSLPEINATNRRETARSTEASFEAKDGLAVGYVNDGFKIYLIPDGVEASDLAERLSLMGSDWHCVAVMVPKLDA